MSSELDKYFGPKPETMMPNAKPSYFAEYPLFQEVCDAFMEEMNWTPDPWTTKAVIAGGRDFYAAHGNNPSLVRRTIRWLKRNSPEIYSNIASPRSLITKARSMGAKADSDSEQERRKYITGEYADFWGDGEETYE